MNAVNQIRELAERYWVFECQEIPFLAVLAGVEIDHSFVFKESEADHHRRYEKAKLLLADLRKINEQDLQGQDLATWKLLKRELENIVRQFELDGWMRPIIFPAGPEFNTIFYSNAVSLNSVHDADKYLERLATFPDYVRDVADNLRKGSTKGYNFPAIVLDRTSESAVAHINAEPEKSPWFAPFIKSPLAKSGRLKEHELKALKIIQDDLYVAIHDWAELLVDELKVSARESESCADAPMGDDYYGSLVSWYTSMDMSPDEVHQLGLDEVSRINDELNGIADRLGIEGGPSALRKSIIDDPQFIPESVAELKREIECFAKQIDLKIPQYFRDIPRITYGIEMIPDALSENMPPAYAQPSPADGSNAGIFWLTSIPEKAPTYIHAALTLHEAWPGHLMHIALLQEAEDLPDFRRNGAIKYTACIEGWALYCESLGLDMGFYDDPYVDFGRLDMEMFRAIRLVVDTGLHSKGWSREQAIDYMKANLTLQEVMIVSEVDRYIAMPGQALAYQIGNLKIQALREKAKETLGDNFSIRDFHSAITRAGAVTLPVLDDFVSDWVAEQQVRVA